jgi:PilZ domain
MISMALGPKGIRGGTRIPVELPVEIRWKSQAGTEKSAQGKTQNMSGNGLFILAPVRLRSNTPVEFTVLLPAKVTNTPVTLQCKGRVVRQRKEGKRGGLALVIDDYCFTPTESCG